MVRVRFGSISGPVSWSVSVSVGSELVLVPGSGPGAILDLMICFKLKYVCCCITCSSKTFCHSVILSIEADSLSVLWLSPSSPVCCAEMPARDHATQRSTCAVTEENVQYRHKEWKSWKQKAYIQISHRGVLRQLIGWSVDGFVSCFACGVARFVSVDRYLSSDTF